MNFNAKWRFAKKLRQQSIPYSTSKDFLRIGNVSITFCQANELIYLIDNRCPKIQFTTHYSAPDTLLFKYFQFKEMIKNFLKGTMLFETPINMN